MATGASSQGGTLQAHRTGRSDWDDLVTELYTGAIAGAPFGIGVIAKSKGLLGTSLKLRLNQNHPQPAVPQYVRKNFQGQALDKLFAATDGLEPLGKGLYKVTGDGLGLPRNCLVFPVENPADRNLRAILVFGGERLEGQLEKRLETVGNILEGRAGRAGGGATLALDSEEKLIEALAKINPKRLFEYDMDLLSRIVNGLEHSKDDLPKHLKPLFKAASDYIIKKRVRR